MRSRALRKSMGEPERRLWNALRQSLPGAKFRRQVPFGPYHADFCSHSARLVLEVDGDDHALRAAADARRTAFLESQGYRVLRIGNRDVMENPAGVLDHIGRALHVLTGPAGTPRPRGGSPT